VDEIAAANGVTSQVTHLVYSHHHADHGAASSLFGGDVVRIGHEETRRLLLRDDDPARPLPQITFADRYTLQVGGDRVELAWHGSNHSPDNIYIHFPGHDTLMFIDVVNAGWVPIYNLNLSEDVIGYMGAPAIALSYPWTHFISGHLGRLATRDDVAVHQAYIADIEASSREALATVDPTPYFQKYGEYVFAAGQGYFDELTERAAAPIIAKYTGCWPPRTSRSSPPPPPSRSCSRCAWTAGPADRSTPDQNAPGPGRGPAADDLRGVTDVSSSPDAPKPDRQPEPGRPR
jgi:glyoxylase-like metal-dependent hydrolase (beta-lactamase superfamily II)